MRRIRSSPSTHRTWPLLLALASGAALLAVVGVGLVQAVQQAHDRAELAARRDARDLATALRALLLSPGVLARVPSGQRAVWRDGSVVVDDDVGWLHAAPRAGIGAADDDRLRLAAIAEFVRGDVAAAAALHAEVLAAGANGADPLDALAAAAWQAHRATDAERAAVLAQQLTDAMRRVATANLAAPLVADAVAAAALLAAARGAPIPAELAPRLAALPPELAHATFARLRERGAAIDAIAGDHARLVARREVLASAAATLRELPGAAAARANGEHLVLWFPAGDAARGNGEAAVVDRDWLRSLPGLGTSKLSPRAELPPVPDRGVLAFEAPAAADAGDADEVVAGWAWVLPAPPPPLPWTSRPGVLLGAAALLACVFAASAWALLRAARREALAVRARHDFLTGVTHELKTPLAAIRLVSDVLLEDDVPAARQREYFALLAGETARLSALIENVLDLGRAERGERAYDLRATDLAAVVRDARTTFAPLVERAGMMLTLAEGVPEAPAVADAGALQQALLAVLDNARKYAAAGQRIELATRAHEGAFTVVVRDHGAGVPAGEREAIFARFERGSTHRHGAIPGVGLGLFLARSIVEHHGGSLRCEAPAEGRGACFVFSLPLVEALA